MYPQVSTKTTKARKVGRESASQVSSKTSKWPDDTPDASPLWSTKWGICPPDGVIGS